MGVGLRQSLVRANIPGGGSFQSQLVTRNHTGAKVNVMLSGMRKLKKGLNREGMKKNEDYTGGQMPGSGHVHGEEAKEQRGFRNSFQQTREKRWGGWVEAKTKPEP